MHLALAGYPVDHSLRFSIQEQIAIIALSEAYGHVSFKPEKGNKIDNIHKQKWWLGLHIQINALPIRNDR